MARKEVIMSRMKIKVIGVLLVLFSFFLTTGAICANAASAITVSGIVMDMSGNVITSGVTVSLVGNPSINTTSSITDGSFSLAGVPPNTSVALKMSSSGYLDVYSLNFSSPSSFNISKLDAYGSGYFKMPTSANLTAIGIMPASGKSVIFGSVVDSTYRYSSNVAGAVVTATGSSKTYPVAYLGFNGLGGGSTYQNGNFYVLNVDAADTVVLQASKTGWTFSSAATFSTVADSAGETLLTGTGPAYDVSVSGSVINSTGTPISGAGIKLRNDGGKKTTAASSGAGSGTFSLGGLPEDATFYLKVENLLSPGMDVPTYVGPLTLRVNFSNAYFWLFTPAEMTAMGVITEGNGLVMGKVVDATGTPISGATVTVASRNGASYTVHYYDGDGWDGSSTSAVNGAFIVPDVQPGDVVRLDVIKAGYGFARVYMDCFGGAVTETNIYGTLFSEVDISKISYGDSVRQITDYDFSAGTKSGDITGNIITIPAGFVTKPSPDEDSLSYTFGLLPGTTGETLSWTAPYPCILQASGVSHNGAVVITTTPTTPVESSAQYAWSYSVKLKNFIVVSGQLNTIRFGLGAPSGNNQPDIEARWLTNGNLQLKGEMSGDTTAWQTTAVVLTGLTPSETTLKLKVEEVTGTTTAHAINFYYLIGGDSDYTLIGTYNIPDDIFVKGFPALFPFINLELGGDSGTTDPFQVDSLHQNNSGGNKYYAMIYVNDPDQATYDSISVVSSGDTCGDTLPSTALKYNGNGQWWLSPSVFLSDNIPPTCYPSYTFTALKKTGGDPVIETRTVTGYVQDFAIVEQPPDTVSGTLNFSWRAAEPDASGYWVQLNDSSGNQIWGASVDARASGVVYSGPPLVSGTYYYMVHINVCTSGGVCNISETDGSFTYSAGGTASESLYGSFTGGGIWKWDGSSWTQLTPNDPQTMVTSGSTLYGGFGNGIWKWDGSTWTQITPNTPQSMVALGENLYVGFENGIWEWDGSTWTQVTTNNPQTMAASSKTVYGAYPNGIWEWDGSTWTQVTPNTPQSMVALGENLYGGFENGIWEWDGSTWTQVTTNNPQTMAASSTTVYGAYPNGIWEWDGSTWTQVTPNTPQSMVALGENLYGGFGNGIWKWDGSTWTQLTPYEPAIMVVGN
jgi:hypothetical protein